MRRASDGRFVDWVLRFTTNRVTVSRMRDDGYTPWINDGKHDLDIARCVREDDPAVELLVADCLHRIPHLTGGKHKGSATVVLSKVLVRDDRVAVVQAIYDQFRIRGLRYHTHTSYVPSDEALNPDAGVQQIRLPAVTFRNNLGTCIDLVVAFPSALASVKLNPVYVHLRGGQNHILAGVWPPP